MPPQYLRRLSSDPENPSPLLTTLLYRDHLRLALTKDARGFDRAFVKGTENLSLEDVVIRYCVADDFVACERTLIYAGRGGSMCPLSNSVVACIREPTDDVNSNIDILNIHSGQCMRSTRQTGPATCVVLVHPNIIAVDSWDFTVRLYSISTGEELARLAGHEGRISSLTSLPGNRLASGGEDQTIRIWSIESAQCELVLPFGDEVQHLSTFSDGRILAGGAWGNKVIKVFDSRHPADPVVKHSGFNAPCRCMLPLDSDTVVRGADDHTVKIFSISQGRVVRTLFGHNRHLTTVTRMSFGRLASGAHDGVIKIWDPYAGECIQTLNENGPVLAITNLQFLPSHKMLSSTWEAINVWR